MKNLKSLQAVALAGVAVALTAGCSSTSSSRVSNTSSDSDAAYRWVSSGGWVPITDVRKVAAFPPGWTPGKFGPVSYETYIMAPPAVGETAAIGAPAVTTTSTGTSTTVSSDGTSTTVTTEPGTTIASDGTTTTVITPTETEFSENLQPGDTFVEAAGANSDTAQVHRVILYTPFSSTGVGH